MKSMKINTIKNQFIPIFGLLILMGCGNKPNEEETTLVQVENNTIVTLNAAQYKNAAIELGLIEQKELSNVLQVNGKTDVPPQHLISISAPLGGFVHSTELLEGTKVKKGQVLVVLENMEYVQLQQDYIDKKSNLAFLEAEFNRQEALNKQNVNSEKVMQQTTSNYLSMKAQVKGLQEKLALLGINTANFTEKDISRKITIYSPIDGYVSDVNVNIGKYVLPNEIMFEIVNTAHLHAELIVFEKDIANLKVGQPIRLFFSNQNNNERSAKVYLIGRKINADRSVLVHAHLDEEDENLLPGMFLTAKIELNKHKVNAVPTDAIVTFEDKDFIFIAKETNNTAFIFEMVEVKKGNSELGFTEINFVDSIINIQTKIATKGAYALLSVLKNSEEEK